MKSIFKTLFIKCICICLLLAIAAGGCSVNSLNTESAKVVLRYAESLPNDHPTTQAAYYFSKLVSEKTQGRIYVQVNCNGVLGTSQEVIQQVELGGIDFARVDTRSLEKLAPEFSVLQLPYLFGDANHMWKVLDGIIGENLIKLLADKGVEGVAWMDGGVMGFYADMPLKSVSDLESLRISPKVNDPATCHLIREYGALPVVLDLSKITGALNNHSIDGAEDNLISYYWLDRYKYAKNYLVDGHCFNPEILIMSPMLKDELSQTDYEIIVECAKQTAIYQRELWASHQAEVLISLEEKDVKINYIQIEDLTEYTENITAVYEQYVGDYEQLVYEIRAELLQ